MRFDWLEYFITTAESGSISAAAEKLGITRPAVSTALKRLEQEVGRELFFKGRSGVTLTEEGHRILEKAQQIMAIVDDMRSGDDRKDARTVSVDTQTSLQQYLNETIVTPFISTHAGITVRLRPVFIGDVVEEFRQGSRISVVLDGRDSRVIEKVQGLGCETVLLGMITRKLFIGAGHPLASRSMLTPEDFREEYIAYYSGGRNHISGRYTPYFAGEYRLADLEDVLSLVVRNEAVVILPEQTMLCTRFLQRGMLVKRDIPFPDVEKTAPVHAVRIPHLSEAEQAFWQYLLTTFPKDASVAAPDAR